MDSKSSQAGQPYADGGKPAGVHHSAGSDALRKAYAKYNINPTMATPAGHKVSADHENGQTTGNRIENGNDVGGKAK
ncbi:hypothetical protein SEPCBS57363_005316 [Sporothrix epigloea]|uniref:Uncharacterized protein n=1 Tax=Sporothrix epigloea TaxID=1892477 RepID=A0ABP0DYR0_9PEZI